MTDTNTDDATEVETKTYYRCVAAAAMIRGFGPSGATYLQVRQGEYVPPNADPEDVARLVEEKFLEPVELAPEVGDAATGDHAALIATLQQQVADLTARLEEAIGDTPPKTTSTRASKSTSS